MSKMPEIVVPDSVKWWLKNIGSQQEIGRQFIKANPEYCASLPEVQRRVVASLTRKQLRDAYNATHLECYMEPLSKESRRMRQSLLDSIGGDDG